MNNQSLNNKSRGRNTWLEFVLQLYSSFDLLPEISCHIRINLISYLQQKKTFLRLIKKLFAGCIINAGRTFSFRDTNQLTVCSTSGNPATPRMSTIYSFYAFGKIRWRNTLEKVFQFNFFFLRSYNKKKSKGKKFILKTPLEILFNCSPPASVVRIPQKMIFVFCRTVTKILQRKTKKFLVFGKFSEQK